MTIERPDQPDSAGDSADTAATPADTDRHPVPAPLEAGQRRTYDWEAIRARYVEGVRNGDAGITDWPSLDAVAAHFGAHPTRVREKSAIEGWVEQRRKWQKQVETVRRNAKAAAAVRNGEELDGKAVNAAKLGLQLCLARLNEIGQAAQRNRSQTSAEGGVASGGIDAQEQQRLAQAVDLWYKIGLRAVGDTETHRVEITGPNGAPVEIAHELRRDDPDRISGVLAVLQQAGLGDVFGAGDDPRRAVVSGRAADGDDEEG